MTEVMHSTTADASAASADREFERPALRVVQSQNDARSDVTRHLDVDEIIHFQVVEVEQEPKAPDSAVTGEREGRRFLSGVRAWMFVPVVDFAMIVAPLAWQPHQIDSMLGFAILGTLLLSEGGRHVARLHPSVLDELPFILGRLMVAMAAISAGTLYVHHGGVRSFVEVACQSVVLVLLGRLITTRVIAIGRRMGIAQHRTILIGGGPVAAELARVLAEHGEYGLNLAGFVDDDGDHVPMVRLPRLGGLEDLSAAMTRAEADTLLVADGNFDERSLTEAVRSPGCQSAQLLIVPRLYHFHTQTGSAEHIGSIPIMRVCSPNLHGPARLVKRWFDIVVSLTAMIVLAPVLALAALAVRIEGGPGVIFRQVRVGRDGKLFQLLKFRSMRPANDLESQTQWSVAADNRVGPVGRFIRCTSIDELPQLWNILRGDMTLVGPRPERPHFVERFSAEIDRYAHRHRVQVGLTGFAQVSGLRGDTSIADRARFDNFYIENWSLWLDIKIVFRTFREVVLYRER